MAPFFSHPGSFSAWFRQCSAFRWEAWASLRTHQASAPNQIYLAMSSTDLVSKNATFVQTSGLFAVAAFDLEVRK
jgi:hypothetical protein